MNGKSVTKISIAPPSSRSGVSAKGEGEPVQAVRHDPADTAAWDAIDEAAREQDAPEHAEGIYQEVLARKDLPLDVRRILGQRAVEFLEEWYDDATKAIGVLSQCVTLDAGNAWALEKLSLLLTLAERWDDLLGIYDTALRNVDTRPERIHLLEEAARIAKDFAGQAARASDYLKQLFLLRPDDAALAASLERRLEQQERFADLVDVWRARQTAVGEEAAIDLQLQIARTQLEPLHDSEGALSSARELLGKPRAEAKACELIERLAGLEFTALPIQRTALALLEKKFAADDRIADTIRVLQKALAIAADPSAQAELFEKLVSWLERDSNFSGAQATAGQWLLAGPADKKALKTLETLAKQTKDFQGLGSALVKAAEASTTAPVRVQLLLRAAKVYRDLADIHHSATELYARVLLDDGSEREDRLLAAQMLRELLTSPAQVGQRLDVLEQLSKLEPDKLAQLEVLTEAAELAERQGDDERSLRLWGECLEREASGKLALDSRVRILGRLERFSDLLRAFQARTKYPASEVECRADNVAIAGLYSGPLSDPAHAIDTWHHVEKTFGRNAQTVDALCELLARTERWTEARELLKAATHEEADELRKTELYARWGDVLCTHLGQPEQALNRYQDGLGLLPSSERCRTGVRGLLDNPITAEAAAESLAKALLECEEWQGLLDLLEIRLERASTPNARQAILAEAASISERHAGDAPGALVHIERAFSIAPKPDLEHELLRLAAVTQNWGAAVTGYQRALHHLEDAKRTAELLMEQGRLLEEKLVDWPEALSAYRRVVELDHGHTDGARAVIRAAGHIQRWSDAAWALITCAQAWGSVAEELVTAWHEIASAQDGWQSALQELEVLLRATPGVPPQISHDVKFQLAIWHYRQRQDNAAAEILLKEAVEEHRAVGSLQLLVEIQRLRPSRDLVTSLLQLSELLADPLLHLDEAARVALEVVGDVQLARPILEQTLAVAEKALAQANEDRPREIARFCIDRLVELALGRTDYPEAFRLLTHGAEVPFETEHIWELKHRAASVATQHLGQHATAIALCEDVLAEQPDRAETIALLAALYEQQGKLGLLVALLRKELELPRALERRLAIRLELARVLGLQGSGLGEQVASLTDNLEEKPGHLASVDALALVLLAAGRARDLYKVLCQQADVLNEANDGAAASALYARAGHLAQREFKDDEASLSALRNSVSLLPTTPVLDALANIHTARGEHDEAVLWLKQRLSLTPSSEIAERRATFVALGASLRDAGVVDEAVLVLSTGLGQDAAGNEIRALLITLQEQRQDWAKLAQLLAGGVPHLTDTDTKVDYLSRAAHVQWRHLNNVTEAIPLLQQAVDLSPLDRNLRLWLGEASRLGGNLEEGRTWLTQLLEEFGRRRTPERAQVHFQLALIDRAEGQLASALEHLDAASNIQRGDALILRTLGDVAREKGELERAETAYRALLLLVGRAAPGGASPQQGESSILYELYKIALEKQDQGRARDLLDSALEKSEHPQEAALLEQTLREAGEWELLHQALQRRQGRVRSSEEQLQLLRDRAQVLAHLGRKAEALELQLNLLAEQPDDLSQIDETAELAREVGMQERFKSALVDLAEKHGSDRPDLSCRFWLQLGTDAESRADLNQAAAYFERAQLTGAEPERTLDALQAMYQRTGDTHGLTLALERFVAQVEDSTSPRLTEVLYQLAEIELCSVAGRDRGVERLILAQSRAPQPERALAILTRAVHNVAPTGAMLAEFQSLARQCQDRPALLLALFHLGMSDAAEVPDLKEAATLATELGDAERLGLILRRTIDLAKKRDSMSDAVWALIELASIKEKDGSWQDVGDLLSEAVKASPKRDKADLQLRLAIILDTKLHNLTEAASLYEKLAKGAPDDPHIWAPLVNIYRRTKDHAKLEACLSRAEQHASADDVRRALRLERIKLLIENGRGADAEAALKETLDGAPDDSAAADLLIALYDGQDRPGEAQALMSQCLSNAIDRQNDEAIVRYAAQLGELFETQGDNDEALGVYRSAQNAVRHNPKLISAILRLLPQGEVDERANLMESLIPAGPSENVEALTVELADMRAALRDEAGQERAMELGFKSNPQSAVLRERLEAWYKERDHWAPLADLIATDAEHKSDAAEATARYLEAARIFDDKLSDAYAAGNVLLKALEVNPHSIAVLEAATQYLTTSARADLALEALTRAIASEGLSEADLPNLLALRAQAREQSEPGSLDATKLAIADIQAAIGKGRAGSEQLLVDLLERQRALAWSAGERTAEREAILQLGELLPQLGRGDEAAQILGVWVEDHPDDLTALRRFADLGFGSGNWEAASQALLALFKAASGEERMNAGLRYAEAQSQRGAPMDAQPVLEQLSQEFPGNEQLGLVLRQMYEAAGARLELATLLLSNAVKVSEDEHRYRLLTDAGELFVATGEPHVEAIRALEEALRIKPQDHRATLALSQALTLQGDIENACAVLGEGIRVHGKRRSPQLAELQYGMARIAHVAGDEEGRFAWLDAAMQSDRKNGAVASELALFCMERGDFDNAIKALQLITLLKEDCPMGKGEAYLRQAHIAEVRGDPRKAALLAKRALTAEPEYLPAKTFLDRLGTP